MREWRGIIMLKKKIITFVITGIILSTGILGCTNSNIKKELEKGITSIENGQYDEAKADFENVLKEDSSNQEATKLLNIINNYYNSKKEFEADNIKEAEKYINEIPSEYSNYKIKDDINNLKKKINDRKKEIESINNELNNVDKLIKDKKYEDAKKVIDKIDNNGTKHQKEKLEGYKKIINEKLKELEEKKKREEEKAKKEVIEKKELERKNKEKEAIKKPSSSNKVNTKNEVINNNKQSKKEHVYKNTNLGIQITFPASWSGLYTVKSYDDGIGVYMIPQEPYKYSSEGFLFSVTKYKSKEDENFKDTVGSKRFVTAKGVKYIIGGPTDFPIGDGEKNMKLYLKLSNEKYGVASTIKAIS